MSIMPWNGLCTIKGCYFNNVCQKDDSELQYYLMWVMPCVLFFLVTLLYVILILIFLRT
jgi:hypothetical protein